MKAPRPRKTSVGCSHHASRRMVAPPGLGFRMGSSACAMETVAGRQGAIPANHANPDSGATLHDTEPRSGWQAAGRRRGMVVRAISFAGLRSPSPARQRRAPGLRSGCSGRIGYVGVFLPPLAARGHGLPAPPTPRRAAAPWGPRPGPLRRGWLAWSRPWEIRGVFSWRSAALRVFPRARLAGFLAVDSGAAARGKDRPYPTCARDAAG